MQLLRNALITFDDEPEELTMSGDIGCVSFRTSPITLNKEARSGCFISAAVGLERIPPIDTDGFVKIPDEKRRMCEFTIEQVANTLSIFGQTARRISSLAPCIAFSDLTASQRKKLNQSRGIKEGPTGKIKTKFPMALDDPALMNALGDRPEGVALLAEVLSSDHPVARYRELMRFFENAFGRPISQVEKKLAQFLKGANLGYSLNEVKKWIQLRDGNIHGDKQKATRLIMEADIRPFIPRMEQAAYDTLFNKATWHEFSKSRTERLLPTSATTAENANDLLLAQGKAASLVVQMDDPFGAFPMYAGGGLSSPPKDWWWHPDD